MLYYKVNYPIVKYILEREKKEEKNFNKHSKSSQNKK